MKWTLGERRILYESWFVELHVQHVELPDGREIDHEVVSVPCDSANIACVHPDKGVLMIYRHRFITDQWGWELPGGMVDPGEEPILAAERECLEETGWQPGPVTKMTTINPCSGISDLRYHLFRADGAEPVGEPTDPNEASVIEWRSFDQATDDLRSGLVPDGLAQMGLVLALASVGRFAIEPQSKSV